MVSLLENVGDNEILKFWGTDYFGGIWKRSYRRMVLFLVTFSSISDSVISPDFLFFVYSHGVENSD